MTKIGLGAIYRGCLFFSVKDRNLFHRVDTIGNIFTSGEVWKSLKFVAWERVKLQYKQTNTKCKSFRQKYKIKPIWMTHLVG